MPYVPPNISASGLSVPSYGDIQKVLLDSYKAIYGSTTYLGNDSADYQWISAIALKIFDNENLAQLVYNNRSPLTAMGAALDSIVKLNGIARLSPLRSTATLVLNGTPGAEVLSAVIQDVNGIQWSLPFTVTIGPTGTISALATCNVSGAISAEPNTIYTPVGGFTVGWTKVNNPAAASVGTVPEADSKLRARQSISVATPSLTRLAGTQADIEAIPNVGRVKVMENQLSVTDSFGNASHSITCVVEGGTPLAVATAIYNNKGIGANTLGANPSATMITDTDGQPGIIVTDPNSGNTTRIGFVTPTYRNIYVALNIYHFTAAYNSTMKTTIQNNISYYLNHLDIGEMVTQSALYAAAMQATNLVEPDYSIRGLFLDVVANPTATADITLNFWEVAENNFPSDPTSVVITDLN